MTRTEEDMTQQESQQQQQATQNGSKEQFLSDAKRLLRDAELQIERLRAKGKLAKADAAAKIHKATDWLQQHSDSLKKTLDEAGGKVGAAWADSKGAASRALDELKGGLSDARKHFG
jgi:hypothetical protein